MAKTAQILSNLNENLFDFFDFAVKKFCGSSLAPSKAKRNRLPRIVNGLCAPDIASLPNWTEKQMHDAQQFETVRN
jgi:hypothetical protein